MRYGQFYTDEDNFEKEVLDRMVNKLKHYEVVDYIIKKYLIPIKGTKLCYINPDDLNWLKNRLLEGKCEDIKSYINFK